MREAGQQSGMQSRFGRMIKHPAQQLKHEHFKQAIGQQALSATHAIRFCEKQFECSLETVNKIKGKYHYRWQRSSERMPGSGVEVQRRTHQVGGIVRRIFECVVERPRIEQQGGLGQGDSTWGAAARAMSDHHVTAPEHVQESSAAVRIK